MLLRKIQTAAKLLKTKPQKHNSYYYQFSYEGSKRRPIPKNQVGVVRLSEDNVKKLSFFRDESAIDSIKKLIHQGRICIAAEYEGHFVGHAVCCCDKIEYDGLNITNGGYIYFCHVAENYRGRNIYPTMLCSIIEMAKEERNVRSFTISTSQNNTSSQRGIEKAGFENKTPYSYYTWWKFCFGGKRI